MTTGDGEARRPRGGSSMAEQVALRIVAGTEPPRRSPVGRGERVCAWGILVLLAGIALGIGWRQGRVSNPALERPVWSDAAPSPRAPAGPLPWDPVPAVWQPMSPPETFDAVTLSDKINGKAELYLTAGFTRLTAQRFASGAEANAWLEFFSYDMRDPRAAFAVYSAQRRPEGVRLDAPGEGYRAGSGLFFVRGARYGEIVASDPALMPAAETWAAEVLAQWPAADTAPDAERALFPPDILVPNSLGLIAANAFGFDRFREVATARLRVGVHEVTAFLIAYPAPEAAQADVSAYRAFLLANGGQALTPPDDVSRIAAVDLFGYTVAVFTHGALLAGVHEAEDADRAWEVVRRMLAHLDGGEAP